MPVVGPNFSYLLQASNKPTLLLICIAYFKTLIDDGSNLIRRIVLPRLSKHDVFNTISLIHSVFDNFQTLLRIIPVHIGILCPEQKSMCLPLRFRKLQKARNDNPCIHGHQKSNYRCQKYIEHPSRQTPVQRLVNNLLTPSSASSALPRFRDKTERLPA